MPDQTLTIEVNILNLEEVKELRRELEKIKELNEEINEPDNNPLDIPDIDNPAPPRPEYPEDLPKWRTNDDEKGKYFITTDNEEDSETIVETSLEI